ncbi:hypothetical protein [Methanothrix soehngenii]|uniref:hypothetical protein n=1 Tax=Methanothrix soehngenii TaxID=2223 RepID=UPI002FE2B901
MLTDLERKRILHRDELTVAERKNLNFRLRKKLVELKGNLNDINLILDFFPHEELHEMLGSEHLIESLEVTELLLRIIDHWPIGVSEDENGVMAFRVFGNAIPSAVPGKCAIFSISYTPTQEEIDLDHRLTDHFNRIRCYIDPCTPDPVCRDPDYIGHVGEKVFKIRKEIGAPFSVHNNAYLDEAGVSETGWVINNPSMVDVNQLHWMRWRPIGLKECIEQPPLLAPKVLPKGQTLIKLHAEFGPDGIMHYSVSEKGGEERSITLEEFTEIGKKFKLLDSPDTTEDKDSLQEHE